MAEDLVVHAVLNASATEAQNAGAKWTKLILKRGLWADIERCASALGLHPAELVGIAWHLAKRELAKAPSPSPEARSPGLSAAPAPAGIRIPDSAPLAPDIEVRPGKAVCTIELPGLVADELRGMSIHADRSQSWVLESAWALARDRLWNARTERTTPISARSVEVRLPGSWSADEWRNWLRQYTEDLTHAPPTSGVGSLDDVMKRARSMAEVSTGTPATADELDAVERALGVTFPQDYRACLLTWGEVDIDSAVAFRVFGAAALPGIRRAFQAEVKRWHGLDEVDADTPAMDLDTGALTEGRRALRDALQLSEEPAAQVRGNRLDSMRLAYSFFVPVLAGEDLHHSAVCVGPGARAFLVRVKDGGVQPLPSFTFALNEWVQARS